MNDKSESGGMYDIEYLLSLPSVEDSSSGDIVDDREFHESADKKESVAKLVADESTYIEEAKMARKKVAGVHFKNVKRLNDFLVWVFRRANITLPPSENGSSDFDLSGVSFALGWKENIRVLVVKDILNAPVAKEEGVDLFLRSVLQGELYTVSELHGESSRFNLSIPLDDFDNVTGYVSPSAEQGAADLTGVHIVRGVKVGANPPSLSIPEVTPLESTHDTKVDMELSDIKYKAKRVSPPPIPEDAINAGKGSRRHDESQGFGPGTKE